LTTISVSSESTPTQILSQYAVDFTRFCRKLTPRAAIIVCPQPFNSLVDKPCPKNALYLIKTPLCFQIVCSLTTSKHHSDARRHERTWTKRSIRQAIRKQAALCLSTHMLLNRAYCQ
jgi:hypothetical protein